MLARKSLLLLTVSMIGSVLGFFSTIVIARWMGAETLGTIGYLLGLLGLLGVLLDMGFAFAHLKRVSETDQDPAALIGAFLLIKVLLALVFLLCVILLPIVRQAFGRALFANRDEQYAYYVIAAFYILNSLASVLLYTFEARLETAKETIPSFWGSLLSFLAKVIVALLGLGAVALSGAYLVEPVVRLCLAALLFRGYRVARATRQHLAGYVRYAAPLTLNTVLSIVVANANPVVIKAFWNATQVGYYTSVLGFGLVMDRVASAVMVPFLPQASSDVAKGNWEEMRRRLFVIERYMLLVLVPLGVILVFFSADIVKVALGAEFAPAATTLACLVVNSALMAVFQPYHMVLYAVERQSDLVLSSAAGLIVLLLADVLLVPSRLNILSLPGLGGTGAALALVLMTLSSGVIQARAARQHARTDFYWKASLHLLAGLVMYAVMIVLGNVVEASLWMRLPLLAFGGLAVHLAVLMLLRQFSRGDMQVLLNMVHPQRMLEYISAELDRPE